MRGKRPRYVFLPAVRLKKLKAVSCKALVIELRDFWRSLPQLEDKSGLDQMSKECDSILQVLP